MLAIAFFSAATLHQISALDAQCRPWTSGPLYVVHGKVGMSCAPGGPCSSTAMGDLPAQAVQLRIKGCAQPQPGRFVPTAKKCNGLKLLKFTGKVPQPGHFSLKGERTQVGYLGNPGVPRGFECPGASGAVKRTTIEHPPRGVWGSPPEAFRDVRELTVRDKHLWWKPLNSSGFPPVKAFVGNDDLDLLLKAATRNESGAIKLRSQSLITETQRARKGGICISTTLTRSRVDIVGTQLSLKAEVKRQHVLEPRQCTVFKD
jgi:hypothetical protein